MFLLSSPEAMEKFLTNPRKYLKPPQPAPPCKMLVLGASLSGKTTLAKKLGAKYLCKVTCYGIFFLVKIVKNLVI